LAVGISESILGAYLIGLFGHKFQMGVEINPEMIISFCVVVIEITDSVYSSNILGADRTSSEFLQGAWMT
jgi:hypothetical protein